MTLRASASLLWLFLGVCSSLGCFYIHAARVQQDITTGEKLWALDQRKADPALRRRLLETPPDMRATIDLKSPRTSSDPKPRLYWYSGLNPGFYASVQSERADLRRALALGVISPAELAELDAELDRQATRSIVRRGFELTPVVIAGSIRRIGLGDDVAEERTPESSRDWAVSSWFGRVRDTGDPTENLGLRRELPSRGDRLEDRCDFWMVP
jgi:hypothetical protein